MHAIVLYSLCLVSFASKHRSWPSFVALRKHIAQDHLPTHADDEAALSSFLLVPAPRPKFDVRGRRPKFDVRGRQPLNDLSRIKRGRDFGDLVLREPFFSRGNKSKKHMPIKMIFLHGKAENGYRPPEKLQWLLDDLPVRLISPTAPVRKTPSGKEVESWREFKKPSNVSKDVVLGKPKEKGRSIEAAFDTIDVDDESIAYVHGLIDKLTATGTPPENIVLGGFSQGGQYALRGALSYPERLGGCVVFSSFLGNATSLKINPANKHLKLFVCHGTRDDSVPIGCASKLVSELRKKGVSDINFKPSDSLNHSLPSTDSLAAAHFYSFLETILAQGTWCKTSKLGGFKRLLSTARLARKRIEFRKAFAGKNLGDASLLSKLAEEYEELGLYDDALYLYQRAAYITWTFLGPQHPKFAEDLNNFANSISDLGCSDEQCWQKVETLYLKAIAINKATLPEKHPNYAISLNNLASFYCSIGSYEKAKPLYLEVADIKKKTFGEEHPSYAKALENHKIAC